MAQDKHDIGLLEYLEEIFGTDKYVAKLEEASTRCKSRGAHLFVIHLVSIQLERMTHWKSRAAQNNQAKILSRNCIWQCSVYNADAHCHSSLVMLCTTLWGTTDPLLEKYCPNTTSTADHQ